MGRRGRMVWVLGGLVVLVLAYIAAWQWDLLPRQVIATGTVETRDGKTLKTRQYYRTSRDTTHKSPAPGPERKVAVWEVQLPSGRWVDCNGDDCLAAYDRTLK
ncbi:hypothetical protein [Hyphomicrobium sp. CS1GBMeth3]|uniref:hypothetical protein n=1 Tax=Hyphomicrobium sp. CS1GBMeth3 TaxID=1892845 RepID=UPI001114C081|nr:hypothetical protein [Hyphomicrobium sp. CS1GBMeth3]